jgi:hypothetical protein
MAQQGGSFRPRVQKKCWCGSGKKEKNCHGRGSAPAAPTLAAASSEQPHLVTKAPVITSHPWGVPGEEHKIVVVPIFTNRPFDPKQVNLGGTRGPYKVQFLLSRPGYPIAQEREHKFIDDVMGGSHIRIIKPESERGPHDADRILLQLGGRNFQFEGFANKDGFLGKLTVELETDNAEAAENETYGAIAPFLSVMSMNLDIPIHVETTQVTDLTTHVSSLRVRTPHFEMNFGGGPLPLLVEEFCQYASIYREGLNTNSAFYRFLCFFKIIESIISRRGREAKAKRLAGQDPRRPYEQLPDKTEALLALLKRLYSWRDTWDNFAIDQIFPKEILGRKVTSIHDDHLRPIRLGIAHALLERGEITMVLDKVEHIQAVNKWLPLCRICARWMLLNEFPRECSIAMK